ncbi:MAG TPA: 3'-5' exonuclease [Candidatus Baltobacteraceae bacterium]|nr:3'-5' exonuclease [Candidatus Baltobacteraceae bacterium]
MIAIVGPSGTGKSTMLAMRVATLRAQEPDASIFFASHPRELVALACYALDLNGDAVTIVDDIEARRTLEYAARGLFSLQWDELVSGAVDPEVAGLRSPQRFLDAAFRLFRKLRDAAISPETFLERCLAGATQFYAAPPNFNHPDLILGTKEAYRDSLDVNATELERQRLREVDLAKILAHLYRDYVARAQTTKLMTARDAIAFAVESLRAQPQRGREVRAQYPYVFIDEAQEITAGGRALLEAIYDKTLGGVTLAGDPNGSTTTFDGARPDLAFAGASERIELTTAYRMMHSSLGVYRAKNEEDEARYLASEIRSRLDDGIAPEEIAPIFRSVADVHRYEEALLDCDVPVAVTGDVNIFRDRRALDAIALLWNLWDPFEHAYLLRTLSGGRMALSDASLALLCSEPPDAQTPLFALDDEPAPTSRRGRFDPKRDLRLGWNVLRGSVDVTLNPVARERVQRFRAMRVAWIEAMATHSLRSLIVRVWNDGLAAAGAPGSARKRSQELLLLRLLDRLVAYANAHPHATLGDVLEYARARAQSDLESCETDAGTGFVQIRSVEASRGRSFEVVVIADARAGSFPRWYVPDAFLFSPKVGMIPKENAGDARAARTAKFTYSMFKNKWTDAYNAQERRAFTYAMQRSRREVIVTAAGKPTRGVTAPEFLAELQAR